MSVQADLRGNRQGELWRSLEGVNDPELDEPVTDMGFIERAEVLADGSVAVDFRLPTYWCSPNFAFLMLDGMRQALEALPWSPAYRIRLHDHMFAEEVNRGVEAGKTFGQIFDELAGDDDIAGLRETFARKAYLRRQEAMLLGLRLREDRGVDVGEHLVLHAVLIDGGDHGAVGHRDHHGERVHHHDGLVEELERLSLDFTDDSTPTEAELRIAQAQLVGWLEGLFHGIQTALFAQQMAARQQLEQMRRALPGGQQLPDGQFPEAPQAGTTDGPGSGGMYL